MISTILACTACGTLGSGKSDVDAQVNAGLIVTDKSSSYEAEAMDIVNESGVPVWAIVVIAFLVGIILPSPFKGYNMKAVLGYILVFVIGCATLFYSNRAAAECTTYCNMDDRIPAMVNEMEHQLGTAIIVTSSYRPYDHPLEISKTPPGSGTHARGIALDAKCSSYPGAPSCPEMAHAARNVGFDAIGLYDRHVHMDIRGYIVSWQGISK